MNSVLFNFIHFLKLSRILSLQLLIFFTEQYLKIFNLILVEFIQVFYPISQFKMSDKFKNLIFPMKVKEISSIFVLLKKNEYIPHTI